MSFMLRLIMNDSEYDDNYPTCAETFSTLRIFSDDLKPEEITEILGIEATRSFLNGDVHALEKLKRKTNGWFYSTEKLSPSKDTRRHIDLILLALEGKSEAVEKLRLKGCKFDITSYWVSRGQGGPSLLPQQLLKLGTIGIEVWWDIYFERKNET